jgi:hypothetical protein
MDTSTIVRRLTELNSARRGSFAEFIVKKHFEGTGARVEYMHYDNIDLVVDKVNFYDVKSCVKYAAKPFSGKLWSFRGTRKPGVQYSEVALYSDGMVITSNGKQLARVDLSELARLYAEHQKIKGTTKLSTLKRDHSRIAKFKGQIKQVFSARGLKVRILFRSGVETQIAFGKYGPKNLLPKPSAKANATVILWLDGSKIYRIIAFSHSDISRLPLYAHKIGGNEFMTLALSEFPPEFVFQSIEGLKKRFPW